MKKQTMTLAVLAGLLAFQGLASAEMLSGTIQSIDPGKGQFTLMRSDTQENVTVYVKDQGELASLQTGGSITVDANKKLFGGWEIQSLTPLPSAQQAEKSPVIAHKEDGSLAAEF